MTVPKSVVLGYKNAYAVIKKVKKRNFVYC